MPNFARLLLRTCTLPIIFGVGVVQADVTYEGSAGINNQILEPADCNNCHSGQAGRPRLNSYDDATAEVNDIIDRINRPQGDPFLMPRNGTKLDPARLSLMNKWKANGVPQWRPPELAVTGHSLLGFDSVQLAGTLDENGRDTQGFFKYWTGNTEPENCPLNNSFLNGCTATVSPDGSGGDDTDQPFAMNAEGLNCATTYHFRAMSQQNGQFNTQGSPTTLSFMTSMGADSDNDTICETVDNCPLDSNTDQLDTNNDAEGDACDLDDDGDGIDDIGDNCPLMANADQQDTDDNGVGDVCENDSLCFPVQSSNGKTSLICL